MKQQKMTQNKFHFRVSIKLKLLLICTVLVTIPAVIVGIFNYNTFRSEAYNNIEKDLSLISQGWQITTQVYIEQMQRILKREESLVERRMESIAKDVNKMLAIAYALYGNEPSADEMQLVFDRIKDIQIGRRGYVYLMETDGTYILSGDGTDGKNVINSLPRTKYLFWQGILERAKALGPEDTFVIHYSFDNENNRSNRPKLAAISFFAPWKIIIGASINYTDFKSYDLERLLKTELKEKIARQQIGPNGYLWVIDSIGDYVVSRDRLQDGENILDMTDINGKLFIREIIRQARRLMPGETYTYNYTIKELGKRNYSSKIGVFTYNSDWDWIIAACADYDDFLKGLKAMQRHIFRITFFFIILGILIAYSFASIIANPISQLEKIANHAAGGNLDAVIDKRIMRQNDEIGRLAQSFAVMITNLKNKIRQIEESRAELVKANQNLKDMQSQLLQSEKLSAIGHLAAGVAHEVNNPLGFISGNIEILSQYSRNLIVLLNIAEKINMAVEEKDLDRAKRLLNDFQEKRTSGNIDFISDDTLALLNETKDGIERIKNIVKQLRTFARADTDIMSPENVATMMENALALVWNEIKYKITVTRDYHPTPPILCNHQKITQVFVNLLINAAQAIRDKGFIRIKITSAKQNVIVQITDTGEGIPEENMQKIFNPFFTTKDPGVGTGLGLSISYDIIKQHNGDIGVVSRVGEGTTFTLSFPFYKNRTA
jgi:signal transduction histidine kinase